VTFLRQISRIRDYRIFRDYRWPSDLHPFARVNVIYGWNGSGKTSLSTLFEHVAARTPITDGEVTFEFASGSVTGDRLNAANVPDMRVFNQRFVERTIGAINKGVGHIYYLGEASIEKQEQVERRREDLSKAREEAEKVRLADVAARKAVEQFATDRAREIKELLLGSPAHANFNRTRFEQSLGSMDATSAAGARLTDDERERLQRERREQARLAVPAVTLDEPHLSALTERAATALARTVLSETLDELVQAPAVAAWVERGLPLHAGDNHTSACRFCGGTFTEERRRALEGHFNDAFKRFTGELATLNREIDTATSMLTGLTLPPEEAVYDALRADYAAAALAVKEAAAEACTYLRSLSDALARKQAEPFATFALPPQIADHPPEGGALQRAVAALNEVIAEHGRRTSTLNERIRAACERLERAAVAEAFDEYRRLKGEIPTAEALDDAQRRPREIESDIADLERTIVESRPAAEELTADLRNYLGREELRFENRDTGYVLLRHGEPASHLSEGEKTAIALLYFLKSLEDRSFRRQESVVVIDDPVSSLDANGLFNAFSFMKERTKDCGQLFVLTHNFAFFRQVKNWVNHLNDRAPKRQKRAAKPHPAIGRYFFLNAFPDNQGRRAAALGPMDRLLNDFESEYHYLFRCVHREAQRTGAGTDLEALYGLPNVARRLLEAFLAFKQPDKAQDLHGHLDAVDFDAARKTRLLRFLNTYSHANLVGEPHHDLHLLAEAPEVMRDLLDLIRAVDEAHYAGLERLIGADGGSDDDEEDGA
jgi:wobble nucleotide-excising tRNase